MTETIEETLNKKVAVIRTMPNTSAQIGHSATAITGGKYVTEQQLAICRKIISTIGMTKIVSEDDMHTVTAISGSGPAFIYYFVEAMKKAALEAGMDAQTADALITQTIIGAGKMLEQSGQSADSIKEKYYERKVEQPKRDFNLCKQMNLKRLSWLAFTVQGTAPGFSKSYKSLRIKTGAKILPCFFSSDFV